MIRGGELNKKHITIDDHRRIGAELLAIRNRLIDLTVRLGGVYPLNDRIVFIADRTWKEIDELRSTLDNELFRSYPMVPGSELMRIYYSGNNHQEEERGSQNGRSQPGIDY